MYRTGDLVRYDRRGRLEYVGRVDEQVKVRGMRVEVGEVEEVIREQEWVKEAIVIAREDLPGDTRLVAYVVPAGAQARSVRDMRAHLKKRLPDYMVPSAFVLLDAMPLNPSGKVDRRSLPPPDLEIRERGGDFVSPRNGLEREIASVWARVFGTERVGVHDDFFDLGGHSLIAARIITRLREAFKIELPLRAIFERPTVAGLAESILAAMASSENLSIQPIERVSRAEDLPLSFAQERLWFLDQMSPGSSLYNVTGAVRISGPLHIEALSRSFDEVVRRHESLRTSFAVRGGRPVQVVGAEAGFDLPVIDVRQLAQSKREAEAARLASEDVRKPFDLSAGPLLRATLVRLADQEFILLLTMHHIISDGWSIGVMTRELSASYARLCAGQAANLPALPVHYADYAAWQRRWLRGDVLDRELTYWREKLAGAPPTLDLPLDRPRPPVQTFRGAHLVVEVPPSLTESLRSLGRDEGVTLFITMLAAFETLLYRNTAQEDFCVGAPVAGRNHVETENLIGFFANILVMRARLHGDPTVKELLSRVRDVVLEAQAHQFLPFEKLVEELQPERSLSHTPLFQAAFALQSGFDSTLVLPGTTLRYLDIESGTAKFDLTLSMEETDSELRGYFEYNSDLFDPATISRLAGQLITLLNAFVSDPERRISTLEVMTEDERRVILRDWNDTRIEYRDGVCLHELFEDRARISPDLVAAIFEEERITYGEMGRRANRLAQHLLSSGVVSGELIGVCMDRSTDMLLGVLGILKAGGTYVPLDPAWPAERIRWILESLGVRFLLTRYAQLRTVFDIQWRLPKLSNVICMDVESPEPEPEALDRDVQRAFWDSVSGRATDAVSAGGFVSSYTGEPFSPEEVEEYISHVVDLSRPYLGAGKRVLELGCGAGLLMYRIAPEAGTYVGLDPSEMTQARNRDEAARAGHSNIELVTGFADDIASWDEEQFDLVIIASTAQFFPGHLYAKRVIEDALRLLVPGGRILLADIMDARRREDFRRSLLEFQSAHAGARTKTTLEGELYFDEEFFRALQASSPEIGDISVMHRQSGFENELGFRYDVILSKAASGAGDRAPLDRVQPEKSLSTAWHQNLHSGEKPDVSSSADGLAYIIFTSGSTGEPKGVLVSHKSVVNVIDWVNANHNVGPGDCLLFVTSLCFDLSVYDIFGALAAGATIRVASGRELRDPQGLVDLICDEGITFWDSAPAALQQLAPLFPKAAPAERTGRLRLVFLSGDWIPLSLPEQVRAVFPNARVVSLGGATEASIWSNSYAVEEIRPHWVSIPYGKPISNARYHVLDRHLNPCPVGVAGELFIGGECLAVGYTDTKLTAEKFIPDPFCDSPGARLYRTGDRARYWSDGNIEFLGRIDHQVKIRGFRIELGEIEVALGHHPSVRECVVLVREALPGDRRLVAYVVPRFAPAEGLNITSSDFRGFLREKLPDYMLPSEYVMIERVPLTANGKVDRHALLSIEAAGASQTKSYVAPQGPTEEALAAIWKEILGLGRVSVDESFFDLGGHSLLATQVLSRMRDAFKVELPLRSLFESTSIRGLSRLIEEARSTASAVSLPEIVPVAREGRRATLSRGGAILFPPPETKGGPSRN
ncbi:MAG TPA: amino acid adenylation domain-containing protein [Blastocatellia bacterium]|nr:amino acid adenylation domain-containing protein [Blastocatellia bacterium]